MFHRLKNVFNKMSQEINKQNSRFKQARFKSSREERIKSMR